MACIVPGRQIGCTGPTPRELRRCSEFHDVVEPSQQIRKAAPAAIGAGRDAEAVPGKAPAECLLYCRPKYKHVYEFRRKYLRNSHVIVGVTPDRCLPDGLAVLVGTAAQDAMVVASSVTASQRPVRQIACIAGPSARRNVAPSSRYRCVVGPRENPRLSVSIGTALDGRSTQQSPCFHYLTNRVHRIGAGMARCVARSFGTSSYCRHVN